LFPAWPVEQIPVGSVTNGVHIPTWHSEPANQLWSGAYGVAGPWLGNVGAAAKGIQRISDEQLWDYRAEARKTLVEYVRLRLPRQFRERNAPEAVIQKARRILDPNRLTLGFARRFAAYKRPNLLLDDPERFSRILLSAERPMQIVVAGKSHPDDQGGKAMVQRMVQFARRDDVRDHVVFLEDYDMVLAQHFAAGVDVWINNPRRPAEACGTSGMKMLVNGGLNCSTLDGWWDEAYAADVGWAIGSTREHSGEHDGDDAAALYDLLEHTIAPEFYDRDHLGVPRAWMHRVRASMTQLTEQFSSDRMVQEYVEQAYLPAARAFLRRAADGARLAHELEAWSAQQDEQWPGVRFGRLFVREAEQQWQFEIEAYLAEVCPDCVQVQLYAEAAGGQPAACVTIERSGPIHGAVNGYLYRGSVPSTRPAEHYTPRIVPCHAEAFVPIEAGHITWRS
jgi:starch phosphorylase